jgi:hypothetical protein
LSVSSFMDISCSLMKESGASGRHQLWASVAWFW